MRCLTLKGLLSMYNCTCSPHLFSNKIVTHVTSEILISNTAERRLRPVTTQRALPTRAKDVDA